MLWTIIPTEWIMDEEEAPASFLEMAVGQARVLLERSSDGTTRVHRVLSTNPADYLRPELQPGAVWDRPGG